MVGSCVHQTFQYVNRKAVENFQENTGRYGAGGFRRSERGLLEHYETYLTKANIP